MTSVRHGAAPEGHQPRPHSGPHDSHPVNLARVATPCTDGPTRVVVGYEPGIPRIELRNEMSPAKVDDTRVARVLQRAFPKPCYEIEIKSLLREDLGQSVARGVVDVGVAGIVSAEVYARKELNSMAQLELRDIETVLLAPASFSVVSSGAREASLQGEPMQVSSGWLRVPVGAAGGLLALLVCVFLLNYRLPRLDRYFDRATRRLDPMLTGFLRTLEWVYGTASGRVFALLWIVLGILAYPPPLASELKARKEQIEHALTPGRGDAPPKDEPGLEELREGAEKAAYPGRDMYEFHSGRWMKCPRPFQCLTHYKENKSKALAGDRDLLCQYARDTQVTQLEFRPEIAVPLVYALLVRSAHGSEVASPTQRVLEALSDEKYLGSPWRACDAAGTVEGGHLSRAQ